MIRQVVLPLRSQAGLRPKLLEPMPPLEKERGLDDANSPTEATVSYCNYRITGWMRLVGVDSQ